MTSKGPVFDVEKIFRLLKGKVTEAEVFQSVSESRPVIFRASRLKSAETNFSCGASLRLVADNRVGFATTNDPLNLESLVNRALRSARYGGEAHFALPAACTHAPLPKTYYGETVDFGQSDKIRSGEESIAKLLEKAPGVNVDLEVETGLTRESLANLKGLTLSSEKTWYSYGFSLLSVDTNGLLWISRGNTSSKLDNKSSRHIREALYLLEKAAWVAPTGRPKTIILEPDVVSVLVASFLAGMNGKTVQKGTSPLSKKLGETLTDSRFSLIEDPLLHDRPSSAAFDDEGIPKQRQALIENGVLKMFIYDLETAGVTQNKPTGNGERSYTSLPSPGYSNLIIPAGSRKTEEIIRSTQDGLWIQSVLGSGQSNMLAGDFSLNAHLAYRIERGEITGRVKDTMISGNVYDVFRKITEIGADQDDTGSHLYPAIAFEGITVNG